MKQRLDAALVSRGLISGRDKAVLHIKKGLVLCNGVYAEKPGMRVEEDDVLEVLQNLVPYVSRGGLKLDAALDAFSLGVRGKTCIDVGASTGGFTQCLLSRGAAAVLAVDTGHDQLSPVLREDERVQMLERTDVRTLPSTYDGVFGLCCVDVSFISLSLVLPRCMRLLAPYGRIICLLKPQFEVGRENVGKKGIVRDRAVHRRLISSFTDTAVSLGLTVLGAIPSPIRGGDGNVEYLFCLAREGQAAPPDPAVLVEAAFAPAQITL